MSTTEERPTEVEAKFTLVDAGLLRKLAKKEATIPGYRFQKAFATEQRDIYLDTPAYRLLRYGYQLRARVRDGQWLATLKSRTMGSEVGIYQRLEIEEPLAAANCPCSIDDLPEPIVDALAGIVDESQALDVICVLDQTRWTREASPASSGRPRASKAILATLSLDESVIRQSIAGGGLAHLYEIEIELAKGVDIAELQVLAERFMSAYSLTPSGESKLARALGVISRHPSEAPENWQGLHPAMHMGEACRIIWREQLTKLLLYEAGVRYDQDVEYVHQARVAIRRARAAARIYQDYFNPKAVKGYLKHLRRTARLLGAVRDMDVAIARLEDYQHKTRKHSAGDLQVTLAEWRAKRAAAHHALVAWLDSTKYAKFVADFLHFCQTPGAGIVDMTAPPGEDVTPFQVRHVTPAMLLANFARVRSYEMCFDQPEEAPVETLHRLRIACKYLRYNLEFVADLLGKESKDIVDLLRKLQDDLGDLNDAVVSKELLAAGNYSDAQKGALGYKQAQEKIVEKLRSQMRIDFARFVAEENRVRLLSAIAKI